MFKRRIRVACVTLVTLFALTVLCIIGWKISEERSTRIGNIKVLTGTLDEVEGVEVSIGKYEYVRNVSGIGKLELASTKWSCNMTRNARISDGIVRTEYRYTKGNEPWNKRCFVGVSANFPQKDEGGRHLVSGKEFSYDLQWYMENFNDNYREYLFEFPDYITFADDDRFYYNGAETVTWLTGMEWKPVSYSNNILCEINGSMYGYVGIGPEEGFDLSEVHMTVNRGIYRFCQDGTAECVFLMEERAEGFSQLWMIADVVTMGDRTYLCYTDLYLNKVKLMAFEEEIKVFEGELLQKEYDMESLYNFSMKNSYEYTDSSVNRIEIRLTE